VKKPTTPEGVSVVVPHYGDAEPTFQALEDLAAQQTSAELQLIVADDCSPIPFPDVPGVTVVHREENGGFGSAVNSGVAAATQPLLLVLNSDVSLLPTFVEDLLAASLTWMPAVVGPLVLAPDGTASNTARHFPTAYHQSVEWLTPLARYRHHRLLRESVGHDTRATPGAVVPVDWVVGAAFLMPTEVFRSVGGFDQGYFMNSEEVDLQRRLRARGIPSVFMGTVSLTHVGGGSSDPGLRRRWVVDSRMRYAAKWGGRRRLTASLTTATAINTLVNTGRRIAGREVHPLDTAREELDLIWRRSTHQAAAMGLVDS
jgi:N-acetylglucosaminyl-diphospho-decaprenol L-rhamnosyltransferase